MQIIPVIDLKNGQVVHAVKGNRADYAPVNSKLCKSPDIVRVIDAYLKLHDFDTFYIADLNAITGGETIHQSLLATVMKQYPKIKFWIDSGRQAEARKIYCNQSNFLAVVGSESLLDQDLEQTGYLPEEFVLSLDYSAGGRLGSRLIFDNPEFWPKNVIIMTLAQVGSNLGPDFAKLEDYQRRYPDKRFIAAGGIRNVQDLLDLKRIGIDRALIASALHAGALTAKDLRQLVSA